MGLDTELQYDEAFAKQVFRAFLREGIIIAMPAQLKNARCCWIIWQKILKRDAPIRNRRSISRSWIIMMTSAPSDGR